VVQACWTGVASTCGTDGAWIGWADELVNVVLRLRCLGPGCGVDVQAQECG
jgi:hypothetical protein